MIKTTISVLFAVLMASAQMAYAQGDKAGPAEAGSNGQTPSAAESEMLSWLFEKGLAQYNDGRYEEAIAMFDGMLAIDRSNADAVAYKKRAANKISGAETTMKGATREQGIADIKAAWNPAPRTFGAVAVAETGADSNPDRVAIEQMEARLKSITIPSLDFTDSNVEDVLMFLSAASRKLSKSGEDVDIALLGMEHATGRRTVSISFADMNLYEALQFVSQMTSLKVEIRPNVVAIMPANYIPASQLITKSYDVSADVGTDFEAMADSGGAQDLFGDSFSPVAPSGPIDVTGFFSVVNFPLGSSAIYQPRFHKLFVKNTQLNLKSVEKILAGLEEEASKLRSQQVEIEAKFVEFSEGALAELGFDWTIYGSGSVAGMEGKPGNYFQESTGYATRTAATGAREGFLYTDPIQGQTLITQPAGRTGQNLFGSAQRSNTSVFDAVSTGVLSTMGGAPAAMVLTDGNIDLRITAMEQEGTADIMSAPRVTTKSGNEALIRVAETHRYPQDFEVTTGQRTAPVIKPQDWEDFDMGVSLKVTPVVDTDSGSIDIQLFPQIMDFKGYDSYTVAFNAYDGGGNNTPGNGGDGRPISALMAFFERRSAQTQVTVADGSTIVLGGLLNERTETFRDQVPFLGDIPFLGRLFRTEGSRSEKVNLTIFVKATKVDGKGMTFAERELARQTAAK